MSLPVVVAGGDRFESGLQYGKLARTRVHTSILNYAATFAWCGLDWDETKTRARHFRALIGDLDGSLIDEMRGIAKGAGVETDDILALNVRTELLPPSFGEPLRRAGRLARAHALARNAAIGLDHPDVDTSPTLRSLDGPLTECSAFALAPGLMRSRACVLAQTWDWLGWQREAMVVLKHADILTITEAGMLAKIGINAHGFAVGLNILRSSQDNHLQAGGAPVHVVLRMLLERCDCVAAAKAFLSGLRFSASSNIIVADAQGNVATFELAPRGAAMIAPEAGAVAHTNHFLTEAYSEIEANASAPASSLPRYRQLCATLSAWRARAGQLEMDDLKAALSYQAGTDTIARSPDPNLPPELRTESILGVIVDCMKKTMLIAPHVPTRDGFTQTVSLP